MGAAGWNGLQRLFCAAADSPAALWIALLVVGFAAETPYTGLWVSVSRWVKKFSVSTGIKPWFLTFRSSVRLLDHQDTVTFTFKQNRPIQLSVCLIVRLRDS